jgi:hypothetical protein
VSYTTTSGGHTSTSYRTEYYQHAVQHSRPGGYSGPSGRNGSSGRGGTDGKNGVPGQYEVLVSEAGGVRAVYKDRYNLIVVSFQPLRSDDGIIEPGEHLLIQDLTVENNGKMPTPSAQDISMSIQENAWIHPDGPEEMLARAVGINATAVLRNALPMTIKYNFKLQPNKISRDVVQLKFHGRVDRVNKVIHCFRI